MNRIAISLRIILVSFLAISSIAKLRSGHQTSFAISEGMFVAATITEQGLAFGLLVQGLRPWSAVGIGVMAAIGIGIGFWGQGRTCGCLGAMMRLTAAQHVLVSATVGVLAVVVWYHEVSCRDANRRALGPSGPIAATVNLLEEG